MIDRRFPGVGRIYRASGTTDLGVYTQIAGKDLRHTPLSHRTDMLSVLHQTGRWDILEGLRDGHVLPVLVYRHWRQGTLDRVPSAEELIPLKEIAKWASKYACSEGYRREIKYNVERLLKINPRGTIGDLPALVKAHKEAYRDRPTQFNRARAQMMSYLSDTLGKAHALWRAVGEIKKLKEVKRAQKYLTIEEARKIAAEFRYGAEWWSTCLTGMGPSEYFEDGFDLSDSRWIHIKGKKRAGRDRFVPRLGEILEPRCVSTTFASHLRKYNPELMPRMPRHSYGRWLAEAGIKDSNIQGYLGHGRQRTTDLYLFKELKEEIPRDTRTLLRWLGRSDKTANVVG